MITYFSEANYPKNGELRFRGFDRNHFEFPLNRVLHKRLDFAKPLHFLNIIPQTPVACIMLPRNNMKVDIEKNQTDRELS